MLIVSTRHCDIPNVILDGKTGLLADERNPEQLAQHMLWLARHPQSWAAIARESRAHIERNFNCAIQGQRLSVIYQELLSATRN